MSTLIEFAPPGAKSQKEGLTLAGPSLFASREKRTVVLSLLLALLTIAVYNSVAHNGFINLDDNLYVLDNPNVKAGIHWASIPWALTTCEQANWHPLTWLSHALDWQLFGKNAAGHHYVSLLWHAANVVLLFLLLQTATGFTWRSLMVAALFAVHPANVESVAWVAERKNVISMFFFLLAMLAYGWYARQPSLRRYSLVPLFFALGLMGKPQVITLPCVLLLWDYWPLQRFGSWERSPSPQFVPASFRWLLLEKIPLLLLSAGDALITMHAQRNGLAVRTLGEYSLYSRAATSVISYARYVGHAFWPYHLSPSYAHPVDSIPIWQIAASCLFLLSVTTAVILARKRYLLVGWLWFLGTLVPMIGIIQVGDQAMAERYAYIPFIGLFWMVVWGAAEAAQHWHLNQRWLVVAACLSVVVLSILSRQLIGYWHDSEALWNYAIALDHDDFMAHQNLGRILLVENRTEEGIREFSIAERLHAYPISEVLRLAGFELEHGHLTDAATRCQKVLQKTQDPHHRAVAWTDLGVVNMRLNRPAEAESDFEKALQSEPGSSSAILGMGLIAFRSGNFAQGIELFSRAVSHDPTDLGYYLLATAEEKAGNDAQAQAAYARAQHLSSDMPGLLRRAHDLLY